MNELPLIKSKLVTPGTPGKSLHTNRIKEMGIANNRLTILTAPAGFGKTTAVLLSLKNSRKQIRWYRLEKEDSFLPIFYSHLIETLFSSDEEKQKSLLHMLHSVNNLEKDYVLLNPYICQYLEEIIEDTSKKVYLVLDDYHNVSENSIIRETIQYFVFNMPKNVSIIITSRVETEIISGKILLLENVKGVTEKELLFTEDEMKKLVLDKYQLNYSTEKLEYLYKYSEGWIAGIYMICNSLPESPITPMSFHQSLIQSENIFSLYLIDFLNKLDDNRKNLLIQLSVMEDFSLEDLEILFQIPDAKAFILWLESSNLYIQKIMTTPTRYRFHSLFSMELERIFYNTYSAELRLKFFKKLATYYKISNIKLAIRYLLKAGLEDEAIALGVEGCQECFLSADTERMFFIIPEFTQNQISKNPYLLLFKAMMTMNMGIDESYSYLIRAIKGFRDIKDYSFLMNTFGVIMVIAYQTNNFQYLKNAIKYIPVAPIMVERGPALSKLIISLFIALVGEDKLYRAKGLTKIIDRMKIRDGLWQYSYLMIRGIFYYRMGQLGKSVQNLKQLLDHPTGLSNDQWRIIGLVSCCNVSFLTRDLKLMKEISEEFEYLGNKYNSSFSTAYTYYIGAHLEYVQRNVDSAIEQMNKSIEYYNSYGAEALVKESETIALLWDEKTNKEDSIYKSIENMNYFKKESIGHGLPEFAQAITGILQKRNGNWSDAEKNLKESLNISKSKGALQSICGCYLQLADLYFLKNDEEKGLRFLEKWLTIAEKNNYIYYKEMDISTLDRVFAIAMKKGLHLPFIKNLIEIYDEKKDTLELEKPTNKIYVKFFGGFQLKYNDIIITEKDFKTKKVSGIFKYILVCNRKSLISRERLASIFWPEADSKAANTSLRVALYELRKVLAKIELLTGEENSIIYETKDGFTVQNNLDIHTDVEDFEIKYKKLKNEILSPEEELDILKYLCSIYDGNFLENSYYEDWISLLQSHYSAMILEVIHDYSQKLYNLKKYQEAEEILLKGMEIDPMDEIGCGLLISLYKNTDRVDRGNVFLRQFKKRFKKTMDFEPEIKID